MTTARRNLILQSISGNKIVRKNFEISVLIPYNEDKEGYWGGSSKPQNPTSKKESKFKKYIYDKIQIGDVIIFSDKNKVDHAGIVTKKITDAQQIKQIGWQSSARPYDLAFAIKKVSIHIPNILNNCIDYQNLPRDTKIVSKGKDKKFWDQFSDIIENSGINPPEIIEEDEISPEKIEEVYIYGKVKDERKGPVKIGYGSIVERRMNNQDSDYDEIELYYKIASPNGNGGDLEFRIHNRFANYRHVKKSWAGNKRKTEWFDVDVATAIDGANKEVEHMRKMYS